MTAPAEEVVRLSDFVSLEPRQREAWGTLLRKPFTLYGGARGGGKSWFLRFAALALALIWGAQGHEGVRIGIFCEDFPALKDRQISRAHRGRPQDRFPAWLGTWHLTDHEFRLHPEYGGAVICFRNLDDPGRYLSAEFAAIFVDELTRNPVHVFTTLIGSLRWPGIEHTPFVASSNPGSVGHVWVKDVFVDGTFALPETQNLLEAFSRESFGYVKALVTDNRHNAASYRRMLDALPERLRKAFRDGNWDNFEGQAFTQWDREVHVVPAGFEHLREARWVAGLDWGTRRGAYVLAAVLPHRIEVVADVQFSKLKARRAAVALRNITRRYPTPDVILYDDQMNQETGAARLIDDFADGHAEAYRGAPVVPQLFAAKKGPGSRNAKYLLLHDLLNWGPRQPDGTIQPWHTPRLVFQKGARYCIASIPSLQVDPDRPEEDIDSAGDDHAYDALCNIALHVQLQDHAPPRPPARGDRHPGLTREGRRRDRVPAPAPRPRLQVPRLDDLESVEL